MNKESKISETTAFLMIFTALFFDAFQALIGWVPFVGNVMAGIIGFFAFMTFWLWFHMKGIKMMTPKRFGSLGLGTIIEMIPFINILPAWTLVVVYLIGTTKVTEILNSNPMLGDLALATGKKIKSIQKTNEPYNVPLVDN